MLGTTIEILQSVRVGMASVVQARAQLPACKMILAVDGSTRARRKMSSRHSITGILVKILWPAQTTNASPNQCQCCSLL